MGRFFVLIGCFTLGVSVVGLFSYTAYVFEALRTYSVWLALTTALFLAAALAADDFLADALGITQQQYIGILISSILILVIGGVIQWVS